MEPAGIGVDGGRRARPAHRRRGAGNQRRIAGLVAKVAPSCGIAAGPVRRQPYPAGADGRVWPHPDGSWDGCETVSPLPFTGTPSEGLVLDTSDHMLRDLDAEAITTYP